MVLKLAKERINNKVEFQFYVILNGIKTYTFAYPLGYKFQFYVILNGIKTKYNSWSIPVEFQFYVILNGIKTNV